jgi:anti-sigma factor RsiW
VTVTCRETRELADPFLSDQLLVETTNEIVRHLETCAACREEFAARRTLRGRLQSAIAASSDLAPRPDLAADLAARLRPATAPAAPVASVMTRRAWIESWWAAAAALLALLGGGLFARDTVRRSRLATLAANASGDHQNCAIKFNLRERPIPLEEAAQRYDPAFGSLATLEAPAGLSGGIVDVLDRHSCVFDGRRFAHVVFRYEGHVVSLLVTNGSGLSGSTPALVANDSPYRVASFDAGSHAVFVVSDLPEGDVLSVAQALAPPVTRRLSAG